MITIITGTTAVHGIIGDIDGIRESTITNIK